VKLRSASFLAVGLLLALLPLVIHVGRVYSNQAPIASFTYSPVNPGPGDVIVFNASASYAPDGSIVQYTWDFGDGNVTTVTSSIVTYAYPIDGYYTVQLTVTDNSGSTGAASAVIEVSTAAFFRVCYYGTLIPAANVQVTVYYYNGSAWVKAPVGRCGLEIKYDNMTQPNLATTDAQKRRNPGYTASILRYNASNIGFDIHPFCWTVFFKFQWGPYTAYWPNDTTRVYTYEHGVVEAHDYSSGHRAYWDPAASTYVIEVNNIPKDCVYPTECHPIIVGILCLPPSQNYLTVRTAPAGITTIPGQGWYATNTNVTLTAPTYVNVSTNTRYRFNYWDVDAASQGSGINPITVFMNANHTATAHYILQYSVVLNQTGLSSDATGTVVTVNGNPETYNALPFTLWTDNGTSVTYSYSSSISSSISGKQFRLAGVVGPHSPITVTGPATVTGNYVAQYLVTFTQTGLDSTATGTVVTVNGSAKTFASPLFTWWVDTGSSVSYSYNSVVLSSVSGKQFRLNSVSGPSSSFIVTGSVTLTGSYVVQYSVTFTHTGLDSTALGTIVAVNGNAKGFTDFPFTLWVDSGSSVTYSYNDIVLSSVTGKRFKQTSVTGPVSPITVTGAVTVTGNYKTQYQVTFDQAGVGTDFTGTVVTIDSTNYNVSGLPVSFWWDVNSVHTFSFASPLVVNGGKQYVWTSTTGLTNLQSDPLTVTSSGSVTGNYIVQNTITFDQLGVSSDFTGTVVVIDGTSYGVSTLPVSFTWSAGSVHNFTFQSTLVVAANAKQYVWTSTTGLSSLQSDNITVTAYGSIVGNYKTQYYLTLATSPSGVNSPSGAAWYDANTYATMSTAALVDIVPGSSRYRFNGWTTADMAEITDPSASTTTTLMDKAKTVTANYVTQYLVTFNQSGVGSDFTGTVVTIDGNDYAAGALPTSFWWDSGSSHNFAFNSPLVVTANAKQYVLTGVDASSPYSVSGSATVTGTYKTQYYLTVNSLYDTPGGQGWYDSGTNAYATLTDGAVSGGTGIQYAFTGWSGDSSGTNYAKSDPILMNGPKTATANWKTQYYLTLDTSPSGVNSPSGAGWYDANAYATLSTDAFVDIAPGCSRYRFNGWTTADMAEITDPTRSPTTVLMDNYKTVTANYVTQFNVTFNQSGVGSDFTGPVVTIDLVDYYVTGLPVSFWWDKDSGHTFTFQSPLVVNTNSKQYVWISTTGGLSPLQSGSITVSGCGSGTGNYKTQYYLAVNSAYDSPTPTTGWFDYGTPITASVTSPWSGPTGTRYVCTGWTGSGSVPLSGSNPTVPFTITQPSSITWNWKTQYLLTVLTDPAGISPQPTRNPSGEAGPTDGWWYDASTSVTLTAQSVTGYTFNNWTVDGTSQGSGVNPIMVTMSPHTATAYYTPVTPPPSVSISPLSATIYVGQSVSFTSTVTGGTPPYSYQWYVNGTPVSGATSSNWVFTPSTTGVYDVYLKVTDANGVIAQSGTATIVVISIPVPVGGYTVSLAKQTSTHPIAAYAMLIALFVVALSLTKRKRK
jgi:uncharacterized repeat protein (TIGR02543 family)